MRKHEYRKKRYGSSRSFGNITAEPAIFTGHPKKEKLTEKLLCECVPRCGIARAVRVSRNKLISHIRESHVHILPPERHRAAGKESGGTAHTGRSGNTLRQMCPVTVRETLSSGRNTEMHGKRVRIFTDSYDKRLSV